MLNEVSWKEFMCWILTTCIVYYACLLFIFYRNRMIEFIKYNSLSRFSVKPVSVLSYPAPVGNHSGDVKHSSHGSEQIIIGSIQKVIKSYGNAGSSKPEILFAVANALALAGYNELKNSMLIQSLIDVVISDCKKWCSIHLEENEVKDLLM